MLADKLFAAAVAIDIGRIVKADTVLAGCIKYGAGTVILDRSEIAAELPAAKPDLSNFQSRFSQTSCFHDRSCFLLALT